MYGVLQHDSSDCGIACIATICKRYGLKIPLISVRNLSYVDKNGLSLFGIIKTAEKLNLHADVLKGTFDELQEHIQNNKNCVPFIAHTISNSGLNHYIIVNKIKKNKIIIFNPAKGTNTLTISQFLEQWTGYIAILTPTTGFKKGNKIKKNRRKYIDLILVYKKQFALTLIFSIFLSIISIFSTSLYQKIIDEYILGNISSSTNSGINAILEPLKILFTDLNKLFFLLLSMYLFSSFIVILRGFIVSNIGKKIDLKLKEKFFSHLLKLPISYFNHRDTGEILSRFNSIFTVSDTLMNAGISILLELFSLLVASILLYNINAQLFFVILSTSLLYGLILFIFQKPLNLTNEKTMEKDASISAYLKETVDGIETIKSLNMENLVYKKLNIHVKGLTRYIYKKNILVIIMSSLITNIQSITTLFILFWGSKLVIQGELSLGSLIVFQTLAAYFVEPIVNLVDMQPVLQESMTAIDRLDDVLEVRVSDTNTNCISLSDSFPFHTITVKNLSFKYGYYNPSLKNINLTINKGEKILILGESGSGKSTLTKILANLYTDYSGSILYDQHTLNDVDLERLRKQIVYMPQNSFLFSGTIRDNLLIGQNSIESDTLEQIINGCSLTEVIGKNALGLASNLSENGSNLSGGERQRLAIARTLLLNPDIFIFDETTNQMDKSLEKQIMSFVWEFKPNSTCISIMHSTALVEKADKIIIMKDGRIISIGTHQELLKGCSYYESIMK